MKHEKILSLYLTGIFLFISLVAESQNVGIGAADPSGKLEISSSSSLDNPQLLLHEEANEYARIRFDNINDNNFWTIAAYIASNAKNDRLNFYNETNGNLMTLTGDGQLGLGVEISPKTELHVGNNMRVLFGIDTLGSGDKLMFLPDLHAFRVGTVSSGAAATYWNRDSIGLYSFASGFNTRAQGYGATAMGTYTEATNDYAFASGYFSNANGRYSTAMGYNTDAFALGSTALGYNSDAEENYSFAAGYFAEAQALYSTAIGNFVQAQSYSSTAIGRYNVGGGDASSWVDSSPLFEIGNGTGSSSRSNAMTVLKNGRVGIGTTFPTSTLHIGGELKIGTFETINDGGSYILDFNATLRPALDNLRSLGTSAYRWTEVFAVNGTIQTSDRRDKTNIRDLSYGLKEIMLLKPVSFSWKRDVESGTKLGLVAQDLKKVIKEVVVDKEWQTDEGTGRRTTVPAKRLGVYYSDLIPVLIKGIQEQQAQIEKLTNKISSQEAELNKLRKLSQEVADLKNMMAHLVKTEN